MGTHPIFESDFDCLTDCQALRLAFEMAKKETEATIQSGSEEKFVLETPTSPPISLRTRNRKIKECFVTVERLPMTMEESGDAPVTTNVEPTNDSNEIEHKIEHSNENKMDKIENKFDREEKSEDPNDSEEVDEGPSEGISSEEAPLHGSEPDVEESEDVTKLSNKELKEKLTSLGITTGPIVDSTRKIYERKLEKLLTKGKDLAYSTDEDAVPEQEVESEDKPVEPIKEKKRTKKAQKSDPVVEEKFSDEEDEEPVVKNSSSRRRSARILKSKSKKDTEIEQIEEQEEEEEEGQNEEAEVEQEESLEDKIEEEEAEVATESKSTESVQVLSTKTAITSHIHTILFLALVAIAGYLLYSEAEAIESALSDIWDYCVESYSRLYYSMMPEIETIQPDTQPAAEPQVGDPVPTDEL